MGDSETRRGENGHLISRVMRWFAFAAPRTEACGFAGSMFGMNGRRCGDALEESSREMNWQAI
jgi:hypothetical protein